MPIDQAKLKAMKAGGAAKVGGQRVNAAPKAAAAAQGGNKATSEVMTAIGRLGGKPVPKVSEAWMFHGDNTIQIFRNPKVTTTGQANAWVIQGASQRSAMGPEVMMEALQHMGMEQIGALQNMLGSMGGAGGMPMGMPGMMGGDDVPNFDEVEGEEAPDLV